MLIKFPVVKLPFAHRKFHVCETFKFQVVYERFKQQCRFVMDVTLGEGYSCKCIALLLAVIVVVMNTLNFDPANFTTLVQMSL